MPTTPILNEYYRNCEIVITAISIKSVARNKASWLPITIRVYCILSNVPTYVVSVLNSMNILYSYRTTQRILKRNAEEQIRVCRAFVQGNFQVYFVYDNLVYSTLEKAITTIDDKLTLLNITTQYTTKSSRILETGLTQDILEWTVQLNIEDIIINLVKDNVKKASNLYQIKRTLITMLKDELKDLFRLLFNFDIIEDRYTDVSFANATIEARFPFYEIDRIEPEEGGQTIFSRPFSFYNEGSILGIYSVLEDIFVTFCRFKKKAYQQKRLKIICGNQMTIARLLVVIRESVENTKDYDKYIQYLANPVQLYIAINRLYTLIASYQAQNDEGELLAYCLERDTATYNVSKRVDEKKLSRREEAKVLRAL